VETHLHLDHCGWNTDDDADGAIPLPNATMYVARAELEYSNDSKLNGDDRAGVARRKTEPYGDAGRLEPTDGKFAVTDSLAMIPTPGHTPCHCSVLLASDGTRLVILGDAAITRCTGSITIGFRWWPSIWQSRRALEGSSRR
jgi:glyoxylase-like metal-dependent hydrolase (beta-lactamase superfamily II)